MVCKSQQTRSEKDPFKSDTCRTRKEKSKRKLPAGKIFVVERRCGLKQINVVRCWAAEERIIRVVS